MSAGYSNFDGKAMVNGYIPGFFFFGGYIDFRYLL
jgi:hypothetical protein